jgi:hypothetical protein
MQWGKLNCKGKMDSEFLADASFVCHIAFLTAAVLREKTEDTLYTGYVRRNLPYFGKMFFRINCIDTTKNT